MTHDDLKPFLQETACCDFHHLEIRKMVHQIQAGCHTDREMAVAMFTWVRDNILYRVGLWNRTASETLYEREGTCTNKANLLVALLRSAKIPAGYGLLKVDGQKYWGPATPEIISKHVGTISSHVFAVVYLDRWICVDPSDDFQLCENVGYITQTASLLQWDGFNHAQIPLDSRHIFSNEYPISDIDHLIRKKPKNGKGMRLSICNLLIKFLRETKRPFLEPKDVGVAFLEFLKMHHPLYYRYLRVASAYKDMTRIADQIKIKCFGNNLITSENNIKTAT
jgi:hypothetical protein